MKIKSLKIKNFLSFGEEGCTFTAFKNLNIFVGPNDSGKTNIIRTLLFIRDFLKEPRMRDRESSLPFLRNMDESNPFEIQMEVTLNPQEKRYVESFILYGFAKSSFNEIFREKISPEKHPIVTNNVYKEHYEYLLEKNRKVVTKLLDRGLTFVIKYTGTFGTSPFYFFKFRTKKGNLFADRHELRITEEETHTGSSFQISDFLYQSAAKDESERNHQFDEASWKSFLHRFDKAKLDFEKIISELKSKEYKRCYAGFSFPENGNRNDDDKKLLTFEEDMRKFVSIYDIKNNIEGFVEIFNILYNNSIVYLPEKGTSKLVFKNNEEKDGGLMYIDTNNIPEILYKLKNSSDTSEVNRYNEIEKFFCSLTQKQFHVGLNKGKKSTKQRVLGYQKDNTRILSSFSDSTYYPAIYEGPVEVATDEPEIYIQEAERFVQSSFSSSGLLETLTTATAITGFEDKIIILDEPGSAFHPYLQRRMSAKIKELCEKNTSQYFMVTHSSFMFDLSESAKIWRSFRGNSETNFIDVSKELSTEGRAGNKVKIDMSEPKIKSVLYSNGVILVEGIGDEFLINTLDDFYTSEQTTRGISGQNWVVLPVGGKMGFSRLMKILKSLKIRYICVADNDALMEIPNTKEGEGNRDHFSPVFSSLAEIGVLIDEEKSIVNSIETYHEFKGKRNNLVYTETKRKILLDIALNHGFLILDKDLEELLGVEDKNQKLLKDIDALHEKLKRNMEDGRLSSFWEKLLRTLNEKEKSGI